MVFGLSLWSKPSYALNEKRECGKDRPHQEDNTGQIVQRGQEILQSGLEMLIEIERGEEDDKRTDHPAQMDHIPPSSHESLHPVSQPIPPSAIPKQGSAIP